MQKKLLVAAVLATLSGVVSAQVTITGLAKASWERATRENTNPFFRITDESSRIIFGLTEDLGGDLKAVGQFDLRVSLDNGSINASSAAANPGASVVQLGNSFVGVHSASLGRVSMGRYDLHYGTASKYFDVAGTAPLTALVGAGLMSQVAGVTVANGTRSANVIRYQSPVMSGLSFDAAWSSDYKNFGETTGGTDKAATGTLTIANAGNNKAGGSAFTFSGGYDSGPIGVAASYWNAKYEDRNQEKLVPGAPSDESGMSIGAGYNIGGGLKVGAGFNQSSLTSVGIVTLETKRTAFGGGVNYTIPGTSVMAIANFAMAQDTKLAGEAIKETGANIMVFGAEYAFSPRTAIGGYFTSLKNGKSGSYSLFARPVPANLPGEAQTTMAVTVKHNF